MMSGEKDEVESSFTLYIHWLKGRTKISVRAFPSFVIAGGGGTKLFLFL